LSQFTVLPAITPVDRHTTDSHVYTNGESIEQFTNVNCTSRSSYQHRDLNAGSESKDKRDHETFYMWLSAHSPFVYTCESVVCQSTGMIAGKTVNYT